MSDLDLARELLTLDPATRQSRLQQMAGQDPPRARAVERLLQSLSSETQDSLPTGATDNEATAPRLEVLGPFKLIELLGRGGMGAVYLAEQDHPRRRVALKLMRSDLVGSDDLKRFAREAGFLARLDHPAIARVLEAGHLRGSLGPMPYLAMEYVQGRGLIEHSRTLGLRARLQLLLVLAEAVQHAHVRGVIHRDLKPDNILIDHEGYPKILDFGIAKAVDLDDDPTAPRTMAGHVIGTPNYMSPEQLAGASIDVRSDVYALGAIAYEVLSGGRSARDFAGRSLAEAQLALRQPPRPLADSAPETRGDLSTIVAKALAYEAERRYQSAAELADDLRRWLDSRPILARPPSFAYVAQRYLARNWLPISVASLLALTLIVATVVSLSFARQAELARTEAETQAEVAREVNAFLGGMLAAANPRASAERPATLLDMVDGARAELSRRTLSPAVEREIRLTLAKTYRGLSQFDAALAQLDALQRLPAAPSQALDEAILRTTLLGQLQRQDEVAQALDALEAQLAGDPGASLATQRKLMLERARWYQRQGRFPEALKAFDAAYALGERELGARHPDLFPLRSDRVNVLSDLGSIQEALTAIDALIADVEATQGAQHPETLILRNDRTTLLFSLKDVDAAAKEMQAIADQAVSIFGPDHEFTLTTLHNLAAVEIQRGQRERGQALLQLKLERMRGRYPPDHLKLINTESSLAVVTDMLGQYAEAEAIYVDLLQRWPASRAGFPAEIATVLFNLARLRAKLGRWTEARADFEQLLARMLAADMGDSVNLARYRVEYAARLLRQGQDRAAAKAQLQLAEARIAAELPPAHASRVLAEQLRAELGETPVVTPNAK